LLDSVIISPVPGASLRWRAAAEEEFIHRLARMIFELEETEIIVREWASFAEQTRAEAGDPVGAERELVSVFVAVLVESNRMAARHIVTAAGALAAALSSYRRELEQSEGLRDEDRMGNFEIQRLMSAYNQADSLASSIQKKVDCVAAGVMQKIA
jgi:hypothetical protein